MAGGGAKHLLVSRHFIVAVIALVAAHPGPPEFTHLNGMKYINSMNDERIKTSHQDNKDISLFEGIEPFHPFGRKSKLNVHNLKRFGEEVIGGNSGNGIVPDEMEGRSEEGGLGGTGGSGIEPLHPYERKGQMKVHRSKRWGEEGLGGNSGNGIVPDEMEGRSEEGGLGGKGQMKVHRSKRWGEEGLGGNSGNGIVPDEMEGRSEEGGLGGSGGTGIEPFPLFGRKSQ